MIYKLIYGILAAGIVAQTSAGGFDWQSVGRDLFLCLIGLLTAWGQYRQGKQEKKLDLVHAAVNSNMGEQLRIACISAETLAQTTKLPEHLALAKVAADKLSLHMADQAKINAKNQ